MASETKSKQISTMLRQGFISDSYLYTSKMSHSPSPPQSPFRVSPTHNPTRPSTTLLEMMSAEQARDSKQPHETRRGVQERVAKALEHAPFKNPGAWGLGYGDVKLTVTARDGFKVSMDVHRSVLSGRSRFFEDKLMRSGAAAVVEICDCDDVEVYVETVVLMYCEDLKRRLNGANVSKILGVLKLLIQVDIVVMQCRLTNALFGWPEWNEFRREWNGPFSPSKNFVVWLGQRNGMVHSLNHSILDRQYTTYSRTKQRDSSIPFSSLLPHKINIYKNCPLYPCPAILSELRTLPNLQSSTNMFRFH
ncbi:hypothetical protein DCAR_0205947 [Daucus carota subsp. sativus]|uniref:BTB domain-containing protein n=1 Tax=Daucus carota subsp. sativus TaxID=79200 RepID=A0AAF1AKM7_DAUCS|nr:hypothetical protein DCAR_0205947 [Daucus carota subsp. sativus]